MYIPALRVYLFLCDAMEGRMLPVLSNILEGFSLLYLQISNICPLGGHKGTSHTYKLT